MTAHSCTRCGAPVKWVISEKGVRFPIEDSSDPKGTFLLEVRPSPGGKSLVAIGLSRQEQVLESAKGTLLFRHHQAVCHPNAAGRPLPSDLKARAQEIIQNAQGGL